MIKKKHLITGVVCVLFLLGEVATCALIEWDFSEGSSGWEGNFHVKNLRVTGEGICFESMGNDAWIEGPAVDLPSDKLICVTVGMKTECNSAGELFYGRIFEAGKSVRFGVINDGKWHEYDLFIKDKLDKGTRFRVDPCTSPGLVTVGYIKVEAFEKPLMPELERPWTAGVRDGPVESIESGILELEHYNRWGDFSVSLGGVAIGRGYEGELLGIVSDEEMEWVRIGDGKVRFKKTGRQKFFVESNFQDSTGTS